jgi:ubiquinone/menaquinone biosynthesis C-methylase UbiE
MSPSSSFVTQSIDANPLPFPDASFDTAFCIAVLEHVFNPYQALAELARVVAVGGSLVVCVPSLAYVRHRVELMLGRLPLTSESSSPEHGWDGHHLHFFTSRALVEMLQGAGFDPVTVSGSGSSRNFGTGGPRSCAAT